MYLLADAEHHSEWIATVAFYKAVQVVEAVFAAHLGLHSNSHDTRIADLKRPQFAALFKAYRPLYAASLVARYLEDSSAKKIDGAGVKKYNTFTDYMPPDRVVDRLLKKRLDVLEQHAVAFLTDEGKRRLHRIGKVLPQ